MTKKHLQVLTAHYGGYKVRVACTNTTQPRMTTVLAHVTCQRCRETNHFKSHPQPTTEGETS